MAGRIRGITIEINGNTTNLEKSLSQVSTRAKDIQKELRDVEQGLRLDPSNIELVAQRQQLLTDAVSTSTERLEQLRSAQQQVQQQFEAGTIGDDQYRAFNREIANAESNLRGLQNSLQQIGPETERLQTAQRALNNYLGATNQTVDDLSSTLGTRLTSAIRNGSASADQLEIAVRRIGQASGRTGDELNDFQQTLRNSDGSNLRQIERDLQRVERQAEETTNQLGEGFRNARRIADSALSGIGLAAAGATAGLVAFVESQTELSTDLARLRTNASDAGFSLESVEDGFRKIAAVSGEADSAVEALSNLVATNFDENQLAEAIELVNGAAIRFSDTLKTEGIADGLQETFASGAAIGPFAELLERSGVNVDVFNKGLDQATKNGTETNFVLEQLSNLGLKDVYDSYLQTNSAITDYNQAVVDSQVRLADLSETFRPFVTSLLEIGNTLLDVALGNVSFSEGLSSIAEQAQNLGDRLLEAARNALPKFLDGISENLPKILMGGRDIVLKVVEGITSQIPKFIDTAVNLVNNLVSTIADNFPQFLETGVRILNNIVNGIINSLPTIAAGAGRIILTLLQSIISNLPSILNAGVNIIINLVQGLARSLPQVTSYITGTLIPSISNIFKNTDWGELGRQIVNGISRGIISVGSSAVEAVKGVVGNIISSAKNALGIRSPSRVFTEFGEFISQGLAIGIENDSKQVTQAIEKMNNDLKNRTQNSIQSIQSIVSRVNRENSNNLLAAQNDTNSKLEKITREANTKIANLERANRNAKAKVVSSNNAKILEIERKAAEDRQKVERSSAESQIKIQNNLNAERLNAIKADLEERRQNNQLSLQDEVNYLRYSLTAFQGSSKQRTELQKLLNTALNNLEKERLDNLKNYIDENRRLGNISVLDEIEILRKNVNAFSEGSDARLQVQRLYRDSLASLNSEILDINNNFQQKISEIDAKLLSDIQSVNDRYDQELNRRRDSFLNSFSLFEEFNVGNSVGGEQLIDNLESQIEALNRFRAEINIISQRNVSDNLVEELQKLGVRALPQLIALNQLTDERLLEYGRLFDARFAFANSAATEQLKGLRNNANLEIEQLRNEANNQLNLLNVEWDNQIRSIAEVTQNELSSLEDIGRNAAQGLLEGLISVQSSLVGRAREIANSINSTIRDTLNLSEAAGLLSLGQNNINPNNFLSNGTLTSSTQVLQQTASSNSSNLLSVIEAINRMNSNQSPIVLTLDGRVVAEVVSNNQARNANSMSLMRGVPI